MNPQTIFENLHLSVQHTLRAHNLENQITGQVVEITHDPERMIRRKKIRLLGKRRSTEVIYTEEDDPLEMGHKISAAIKSVLPRHGRRAAGGRCQQRLQLVLPFKNRKPRPGRS